MTYLLLHPTTWSPAPLAQALEAARVETRVVSGGRDLVPDDRPTVFLLEPDTRSSFSTEALRAFVDAGGAIVAIGREGEDDVPDVLPTELLTGFVRFPAGARQLLVSIRAGYREAAARVETGRARAEVAQRSREIGELTRIGTALGTERDLKTLLNLILDQARRITKSDAGSLYLVETDEETGIKRLRFMVPQNFTKPDLPFVESTMRLDRSSLAGYTATTGDPLVIDDAYFLPPDVEYTINRSFDERYGYRSKSMLVIPMKDHRDVIIGVLQLINRKQNYEARLETMDDVQREVVPYSKRTVDLVTALAGQAAVSIENAQLYQRINRMFKEFVDASVQAIEQRDPITKGHSKRVAGRTVGLAKAVDSAPDGPFRLTHFTPDQIREIEYAGLLHDFGKVGVREHVLQKAKKLFPDRLELIKQRHAFVRRSMERDFWRARVEFLERHGADGYPDFLAKLDDEQRREAEQLDQFLRTVISANEPNLLAAENAADLAQFGGRTYLDLEGQHQPLLTRDEVQFLTIRKGSLDEKERKEIEGHVEHTWNFLQEIKWTPELARIPIIAYGHHEKLDGTGYPRGISGDAIPIQTRMMTISDIYDALVAQDRPYKKKVMPENALDIMHRDLVTPGQLDGELFNIFIDAKVFAIEVEST
ncbi:MAG TPA: HD domain-containing phosphohydrolase [Gemmatimonadales bacterium]|nr:HD domain-containing phosphohydrolase [Gemmatimonadales bacterium]